MATADVSREQKNKDYVYVNVLLLRSPVLFWKALPSGTSYYTVSPLYLIYKPTVSTLPQEYFIFPHILDLVYVTWFSLFDLVRFNSYLTYVFATNVTTYELSLPHTGNPSIGKEIGRGQYGVVYSCDKWPVKEKSNVCILYINIKISLFNNQC